MSIESIDPVEYADLFEKMAVTPAQARAYLEHLGYTEETWDEIMKKRIGSHNVRAYISIARGGVLRLQGEVYQEERMKDDLPPRRNKHT